MRNRRKLLLIALLTLARPTLGWSEDVRFVQENGITYRVTRRTVEKPITELRTRREQQTIYRREVKTEQKDFNYQVWVPVTNYVYHPKVEGWWNPFQENRVVPRWVPRTTWQPELRKATIPVMSAHWVPETQTVQRPFRILRIDTKEEVERVAIGRTPGGTTVSSNPPRRFTGRIGGIARLDGDPPRQSTRPALSGGTVRR